MSLDNLIPVGFLVSGQVQCPSCTEMIACKCPIYVINIHPYSAHCVQCGELVYQGSVQLELFESPVHIEYCQACSIVEVSEKGTMCTSCAERISTWLYQTYTQEGAMEAVADEISTNRAETIRYSVQLSG